MASKEKQQESTAAPPQSRIKTLDQLIQQTREVNAEAVALAKKNGLLGRLFGIRAVTS